MNGRLKKLLIQSALDTNQDPNGYYYVPMMNRYAELILTDVISSIYRSDIGDKKQERLVQELAHKFGLNSELNDES